MKRTLLMICTLAGLFFACSKGNPGSPDPIGPGNGTHDTTPAPPKHDTTPTPPAPPPTEPPGKSVVTGLSSMIKWLNDDWKETICQGAVTYVRLVDKDTSHYSAEILNAHKGTCQIIFGMTSDSTVVYQFSNVYHYTTADQGIHPDSAGNLQVHVYRKDGKNIKMGVKDIYMVLEKGSGNIIDEGLVGLGGYQGDRRALNVDSFVNIIARKSTETLLNSDGF